MPGSAPMKKIAVLVSLVGSGSAVLRHRGPADAEQKAAPSKLATWGVQKEIESMALRAEKLEAADAGAAAEVEAALEEVEAALATRAGEDPALAGEIDAVRADLCARHGFEGRSRQDCEAFMRRACFHKSAPLVPPSAPALIQLGDPAPADAAAAAPPSVPALVCMRFFRGVAAAASRHGGIAGASPSPAAAGSPAAAPPAEEEEDAGKAYFGMDGDQGLQAQGFDGPLVQHENQETQTDDWQREFGPKAGHMTVKQICLKHPENEWCRMHLHFHRKVVPEPEGWWPFNAARGLSGPAPVAALLAAALAAINALA